MWQWFKRLFARNTAPAAPDSIRHEAPSSHDAPAEHGQPTATPRTPLTAIAVNDVATNAIHDTPAAPAASHLPSVWRARLEQAAQLRAAHAVAAQQPDAAALLQLLDDGPEAVIRQIPSAAREALTLIDDASLSRSQLAARLETDPALVQALLRTANSAAFAAGRGEVLGITQALERIGVTGTRAVVLASCVNGLLSHPGGDFNVMATEVWNHMVRTAPLARVLAPAFAAEPEEAFAVALLHDVGKLVVFDRISVLRASRRRPITLDADFAHQLVQLLHEPLGALAATQWALGDRAASAIGNHHRTLNITQRDSLSEVLFVAEQADHAWRRSMPLDIDALWQAGQLTGSPARAATALQAQLATV